MKRLLGSACIILAAATLGGWWWSRASLPPLDGEIRLAGLTAPVEILIDEYGVPHAYADGPDDAWFAAGVLHTRDRLWQMELYRRASAGRLSQVLGEETLPIDKRLVSLGLREAALSEWQAAPAAVRSALARYADGVNAQMAQMTGRHLPLEFQILRFAPAPWTPVDSLAVGRLLAWRLAENHQAELVRSALAARFGAAVAAELAGRYPAGAPTIVEGSAAAGAAAIPDASKAPTAMPATSVAAPSGEAASSSPDWPEGLEWLHPSARRGNSNNWVVAGGRTATGRPILGNDPHLQIEFPSVWYELHLVASGLDVIGVTVPGTPFVVIGHNDRIAWGLTNTGADVQDLYVERLNLTGRRYFYEGRWFAVQATSANIPVRGRAEEPFEVWRTHHGTIFAEVGGSWDEPPRWLSTPGEGGERRAFALRWDVGGEMAGAFEALNRARSWAEFLAAVERFSSPSQNFAYADVDGNIGYAMSGALPVRASGDGTSPRDGTTTDAEWVGRVAASLLPRLFNPPSGFITSSNNAITRGGRAFITRDWAAPYRALRAHEILGPQTKLDAAGALALQNDTVSAAAVPIIAGVPPALAAAQRAKADSVVIDALARIGAWDRRVDERAVVAMFQAFEQALWRRTFYDEMGSPLFERFFEWAGAEKPAGLYAILDEPSSRWFDDISTIERRETRDDIYALAARDAVESLRDQYGSDGWNWHEMHAAAFKHPLGAAGAPVSWLFNRGPSPIGGDIYTLMRTSFNRVQPYGAWEIPSWRQVLDVGNWDDSRVVLPAGQSGHPLSAHYFDQNDLWRQGQYRAQPFSRAAVDAARRHRLLLVP